MQRMSCRPWCETAHLACMGSSVKLTTVDDACLWRHSPFRGIVTFYLKYRTFPVVQTDQCCVNVDVRLQWKDRISIPALASHHLMNHPAPEGSMKLLNNMTLDGIDLSRTSWMSGTWLQDYRSLVLTSAIWSGDLPFFNLVICRQLLVSSSSGFSPRNTHSW